MESGTRTRDTALMVLKEVNRDGRFANISLKHHLRADSFSEADKAFITQLAYGTLERQSTLDWVIRQYAKNTVKNPWVLNILRLSAYQILYLDRVPDSAAVHEAVTLCARRGLVPLKGFVNGVLRSIVREKDILLKPDPALPLAQRLARIHSYPLWMVEQWLAQYGPESMEGILTKPQTSEGVSIRVQTRRMGKEALQTALEAMGIRTEAGRYLPEACLMYRPGSVEDNPCYRQGCFTVQGESSMLVTHLLDPQPGERILDACSAPGGKTTHMADRMGCGEILAWDLHPHRIDLVRSHCRRMGVETMVQAEVQDAAAYRPDLAQTADRVLLDAPCTGWGIAHKKPDVKLKADPKARDALSKLQPVLLDHCSRYVKKGGVLVYSTCTINKKENDEPIRQFLDTHGDFVLEDFTHLLPEGLHAVYDGSGMLQLLPGRDQTDGFFIAKLRRKG